LRSSRGIKFKGFRFHDQPGEISFPDTDTKHGGESSLRMENFRANPHGHGRLMQEVQVQPHRCYRISVWETEGFSPMLLRFALAGNRTLPPHEPRRPAAIGRKLTMFKASISRIVCPYAGVWGGRANSG
jgi:hypothetical protein